MDRVDLTQFYEDTQKVDNPEEFLKFFTNCDVLSTVSKEENEEQWLKNRSLGIGGSDIGTICGVNNYATPRMLYFKKTGQHEDNVAYSFSEVAKERMHFGNKLEPLVADEYMARTGNKVVICPATLKDKKHPWKLANVDRIIVDDDGVPTGILEIKTTDARLIKNWEDGEVPMSYIYQLQWYLDILDLNYGAFATLIGGNRYVEIEVYRNLDLCKEMHEAGNTFWNYHVSNMIEPEVTGSDAEGEFIKASYGVIERGSEITLAEESDEELIEFIVEGKKQIKELEKAVKEAIHKVQIKMGNNEIAYTNERTVKWSPQSQSRVDTDTLKIEYPEVYMKCKKTISFRKFTIK